MARVVLVHGIAQSRKSADTLESTWVPALAGGIRNAGHSELADRLWRDQRPGDLTVRMAFYGDLYRAPGAQGPADAEPTDPEAIELEQQLALAWLAAAAERAPDVNDRRTAQQAIAQLTPTSGAQGLGAVGSVALDRLARIRWLAPVGFGFAAAFVKRAFREVSLYLTDPAIRMTAQNRVLEQIDDTTQLVIAHSLGSVVAYEALHRIDRKVALITIGSPLALRTIIYERIQPQPPSVPPSVIRWSDFADRDDLIAVHTSLQDDFAPGAGSATSVNPTFRVDNGRHAHDAEHYLTEKRLGHAAAEALST